MADCTVTYEGRATSFLDRGTYLIIKKPGGELLVHTSQHVRPINYQGKDGKYHVKDNELICRTRSESLTITVHNLLHYHEPDSWDHADLVIQRTEAQLVGQITAQLDTILDDKIDTFQHEYNTPYGLIDILCHGTRTHIVEVKRKIASVSAAGQVLRYKSHFEAIYPTAKYWLLSPKASKQCLAFCEQHSIIWKSVNFRSTSAPIYAVSYVPGQPIP